MPENNKTEDNDKADKLNATNPVVDNSSDAIKTDRVTTEPKPITEVTTPEAEAVKPEVKPIIKEEIKIPKYEKPPETKSSETKKPETVSKPELTKTIIQKRGGVGLLTTTFLSCVAALGGAYLALFVQSRPDLMETLKIAPFLPKSQQLADLNAIQGEIADIQKQIASNQAPVNITASAADATQNQQLNQTGLNPDGAQDSAKPNDSPNDSQVPLQNAAPTQAQIATAQAQGSLEPLRADMAGMSGRLTAIETRLAALDPTGTGGAIIAALQAEVATLKVTVANLQQQVAQTPSPNTTFAVMTLAEAANRNGTFLPEYEAVRSALPYLPEVAPLEQYAKTGVPTRDMLRANFAEVSKEIIANDGKSNKQEKGIWGFIKGLFAKAFKVEVKENNPNTIDQIITRANVKLNADDLQGAVAELQNVQNPPQSLVAWIESAKRRQDLEVKISALRSAIERNMYVQGQIVNPALAANGTPAVNNNAINGAQQPNQQYPQLPQQPILNPQNQQAGANNSATNQATHQGGNAK